MPKPKLPPPSFDPNLTSLSNTGGSAEKKNQHSELIAGPQQEIADPREELKKKVSEFPLQPGVYLMKSKEGKVLYVGKAKILRHRVKSYFNNSHDHSVKTVYLMRQVRQIDFILTHTEQEALLLEATLIKKHRPRYNIRLKDDKAYPYIKISWSDKFPRLYFSRKVKNDGSLYFGPYSNSTMVSETIKFLNKLFRIRDCTDHVFATRERPCLTYQIGRCSAPCVDYIHEEQYKAEVLLAVQFLEGKSKKLLKSLEEQMWQDSEAERFEQATKKRDAIKAIKAVLERQRVVTANDLEKECDVIQFVGGPQGSLIETLIVRGGQVIGSFGHFFKELDISDPKEEPIEWLTSFLTQYYQDNFIPSTILVPVDLSLDIVKLLENVLLDRSSKKVKIKFGKQSENKALMELALKNAEAHLKAYTDENQKTLKALQSLQEILNLPQLPSKIECLDISNFQGNQVVGAKVCFEEGKPAKEYYRRYQIKSFSGQDDFQAMAEVISRRAQKTELDPLPDLIVIDGGKGQLQKVLQILNHLKLDLAVVGLAKARTDADFRSAEVSSSEERIFIPGRSNPVALKPDSPAFQLLVQIRDEAHRFAIEYHRNRRDKALFMSKLDLIVGIGPKRKKLLLEKFGSIHEISKLSAEEISRSANIDKALAMEILKVLENLEN